MKRKNDLPELLSPAGGIEALYAAAEAGADAVYLGVADTSFNARAGAKNFTTDELSAGILYAHARGMKVYVAMNTLQFDRELPAFLDCVGSLRDMGADALIVADMGCARSIAARYPGIELHASTQAFVHSLAGAEELFDAGFARVVLSRELSEENIRRVTSHSRAEVEVFLHGALCVCHSGQCLFSSVVGGRSGNRGECAQPCRLPYSGGYPLSLKDMCLAPHIPALIDAGVSSLKIEGRMKAPGYVYEVTRIYRRLLDERRAATQDEMQALKAAFSRDGFTDAYFTGKVGKGMTGVRREEDKTASRDKNAAAFAPGKLPLGARATVRAGEPFAFSLSFRDPHGKEYTAAATGAVPMPAEKAALTEDVLTEKLTRMGDTCFSLAAADLSLSMDEGLFLPVGGINAVRRSAVAALEEQLRRVPENTCTPLSLPAVPPSRRCRTALCRTAAQMRVLDRSYFDLVFLSFEEALALPEEEKQPDGVLLPPVLPDSEEKEVREALAVLRKRGIRYAMVSGAGTLRLAREEGFLPYGDFRLNITNRESAAFWREHGCVGFVLSPELSPARARDIGEGGYFVYGRIPLMLTERCFVKETAGCASCGKASLTDRRGISFPVLREWKHRDLICNSLPTYLGDDSAARGAIRNLGEHFFFSTETPAEIKAVLTAYKADAALGYPVRRAFH